MNIFQKINQRSIAAIMSFGRSVLICALSFDLMDEAYKTGGFDSTTIGFLSGALCIRQQIFYYLRRVQSIENVQTKNNLPNRKTKEANGSSIGIINGWNS